MSFTGDIKQELLSARPKSLRQKQAQAYGLFAFARAFSPDEICLHSESEPIAGLYRSYLRQFTPSGTRIEMDELSRRGKPLYRISLPLEKDRRALLARFSGYAGRLSEELSKTEEVTAFLAGAYLACGGATDPEKGYHLEFAVKEQPLAEELAEVLEGAVPGVKQTLRRKDQILYYKECGQIEDILTLMGASKACLVVIDVEIMKNVRNQAMRATNCETANIDKLVRAAASQIQDIELILSAQGLDSLPEELRETALLRLENPEMSLRELAGLFEKPVSRSGLHHRLDKLGRIAKDIKETGAGEGTANE